ncbi:hypothetical protein VSAK1_11430 [Vibrio mediterranei AK1]|nr:hypothetical protein VSAK1_11430 [Vibrio mediterranei AK1]
MKRAFRWDFLGKKTSSAIDTKGVQWPVYKR